MMDWSGFGRKMSWPDQGTTLAFGWKDRRKKKFIQDSWCPAQNSKRESPEHKSSVIPLDHSISGRLSRIDV
jgi:hypothetical protein